jgi:hypothetical protein
MLTLPAMLLLARKASDREIVAGTGLDLAGIANYYYVIPERPARELAGNHVAMFAGFQRIPAATPADAVVMWMRPDYVALLGKRRAVPWFYRDTIEDVLRRIQDTGATHLIIATVVKADVHLEQTEPVVDLLRMAPYVKTVYLSANPVTEEPQFGLFAIDRAAVAAHLAQATR